MNRPHRPLPGVLLVAVRRCRHASYFARFACAALLGGCAGESPDDAERDPREVYTEGRVPLPECPSFDYGRCDVHDPACLENLAGIARCLRGGQAELAAMDVQFLSEQEAYAKLTSTKVEPRPQPDHFEIALTQFGLSEAGAFQPEATAQRFVDEVGAYYERDSGAIIVIEHSPALAPSESVQRHSELALQQLLVHEFVHALQDREHDLDAFGELYERGSTDARWRGRCLVEGEARLHDRRYFAALTGLDIAELDVELSFDNYSDYLERLLFERADLYSYSALTAPYGVGAAYVLAVWNEGGAAAVRALYDAPPDSVHEVLAGAWGGDPRIDIVEFTPAAAGEIPGATVATWSALGAWGVYLISEPLAETRELARDIALAWRGDLFEAFAGDDQNTLARWRIAFADAQAAERALSVVARHPLLEVTLTDSVLSLTPRAAPVQ